MGTLTPSLCGLIGLAGLLLVALIRLPFWGRLLYFLSGLVAEPDDTGLVASLSLGRCTLLSLHVAFVWALFKGSALLVSPVFSGTYVTLYLILAAYNYGKKPWVQSILRALAGAVPLRTGAIAALTAPAAAPMPAPTAPALPPAASPTGDVADDGADEDDAKK